MRREPASTAPLFRWLGRRPPPGDETVETVQGAPRPDTLLAGSAALPLVGLHRRGAGGVLAVHFRPSALRGLDGAGCRELWRRLIERAQPPADQTGRPGVLWSAFERLIEQEKQRRGPLVAPATFALLYLLGLAPLVWWGGRRAGPAGRLLGLAAGVVLFAGLALALRGRLPRVGQALITLGVRDVDAGWALERRLIALHHAAGRGRLSFVHDPSSDRVDALRFDLIGLVQAGEHELRSDGRLLERDGPLAPARLALLRPESGPTGWRAEWHADGRLVLEHPYARLRDPLLVISGAIYRLPDTVRGRHLLQAVRLAAAPAAQDGLQAALLHEALSPGRLPPCEGLLIARLDAPSDPVRFPGLVHDPTVLLLDEPASGLDPRGRLEMRELLAYGRLPVLEQLSLHVGPGEIYGLIGPNGAGKTTTLRILATLLPPTAGQGLPVVLLQCDRAAVVGERLGEAVEPAVQLGAVEVRRGAVRGEGDRLIQVAQLAVMLSGRDAQQPALEVGARLARGEPDRGVEVGQRPGLRALPGEQHAALEQALVLARVEGDGAPVVGDRGVDRALLEVQAAAQAVGRGEVRIERDRPLGALPAAASCP